MKSKVIHTLVLIGAVTVRLCLIRPQVALADEDERTWFLRRRCCRLCARGMGGRRDRRSGNPRRVEGRDGMPRRQVLPTRFITAVDNRGGTYNLLIAKDTSYRDLEIEVMVKAGTGNEDQGGGPIWRAADADNYYVVRWNPLEDNFRVYFVKDGRRGQIASAEFKADPGTWHEIEIEHEGHRIEASMDGKKLIQVSDSTFTEAGMVGLWSKVDAATAFDDLEVEAEDEDGDDGEHDEHDEDD